MIRMYKRLLFNSYKIALVLYTVAVVFCINGWYDCNSEKEIYAADNTTNYVEYNSNIISALYYAEPLEIQIYSNTEPELITEDQEVTIGAAPGEGVDSSEQIVYEIPVVEDETNAIVEETPIIEEPIVEEEEPVIIYSDIVISDYEYELLKKIVAAESQTQDLEGRMAVVEVIFNRVLSDEFPDTVYDVISQSGQFTSWGCRNQSWVEPEYAEEAIQQVLSESTTVLPNTTYVYFSRGKSDYADDYIKIQDHWFGNPIGV